VGVIEVLSKHKGKTIEEILSGIPNSQRETAEKLRLILRKTLPKALERVKWGNITYLLDGEDLVWILFYADHVDFGFFRGAELASKLLQGTGKALRHIEIAKLLKEAAKLTKS
jgi:hypothetical protein